MRKPRWRAVLLGAALVCLAPFAAEAGPTYAIRNARIVPVAGPVIEKGTVVMRDGLIVAVGANVEVPAGAIVIEGAGLHVYPGFIDAHTNYGVPRQRSGEQQPQQPAAPAGAAGLLAQFLGQQPAAPGQQRGMFEPDTTNDPSNYLTPPPRGVSAERLAAWEFTPASERANLLGVGITTVLSAPREGIVRGQSAVVNLGNGNGTEAVVRTPVALHIQLAAQGAGGQGYPSAQLGVIAALRQAFTDAQWYGERKAQWERRNGRGVPRPPYSPTSEALLDALAGREPVVFHVTRANDILKALALAEEFKLRAIIEGGHEAWKVAEALKKANVPVIVSLNFRAAPGPGGGGFGGFGQQQEDDEDVRAREEDAVKNAAELAKAGVKVAFTAGGLANYAEFAGNVRRAAEHLGKDKTLEALTRGAAEILGVESSLGTIEPGKVANLLVASAHPLDQGVQLKHVFVDGEPVKFQVPEAPRGPGGPGRGGRPGAQAAENDSNGDARAENTSASPAAPALPREYYISGATILTVTRGAIPGGTIHVKDGKIAAVGRNLKPPAGAHVIDAQGKFVMPGIIDMHSHAGIDGGVNEGSLSVTAQTRIRDVIRPDDLSLYRALAGGVTTLHLLHGSANVIGGEDAILRLKYGRTREEMLFPGAGRGIKFALGENPKRSNAQGGAAAAARRRYPATRMGVEDILRESFTRARQYMAEWDAYQKAKAAGQDPAVPRRDWTLETLAGILRGEVRVHAHSYRSDEIVMLLRVADEFGFKVRSLEHALEAYKVAPEVKKHGAGVSTFADNWAYKLEAYDAIPYNAAILLRKGVPVAINSDSNERVRRLYQEAAKVIKYGGISEEEALKTITLYPAMMLDIDKRVGSIEAGKDADLAIFSAHPFDPAAHVVMTLVEGEVFFDRAKDLADRKTQRARQYVPGELLPAHSCDEVYDDEIEEHTGGIRY
jgi:imidazolonepropionase-like amidohydrolase